MKVSIKAALALILLFGSCSKDDDCVCQKYTKVSSDIYDVSDVPCQQESSGIDSEGNEFKIICD